MIAKILTLKLWARLSRVAKAHVKAKYGVSAIGRSALWFKVVDFLDPKPERRQDVLTALLTAVGSVALTASEMERGKKCRREYGLKVALETERQFHARIEQEIRVLLEYPDVEARLENMFDQALTGDRDRKREAQYRKLAQQFPNITLKSGTVVSGAEQVRADLNRLRVPRSTNTRYVEDMIVELDAALKAKPRSKGGLSDVDRLIVLGKSRGRSYKKIAVDIQKAASEEFCRLIDAGIEPPKTLSDRRTFSTSSVRNHWNKLKDVAPW